VFSDIYIHIIIVTWYMTFAPRKSLITGHPTRFIASPRHFSVGCRRSFPVSALKAFPIFNNLQTLFCTSLQHFYSPFCLFSTTSGLFFAKQGGGGIAQPSSQFRVS